jgi:iron complex outermembrane receptor protein
MALNAGSNGMLPKYPRTDSVATLVASLMLLVALPGSGRADTGNVGDADNAGLAEIVVTAQRRSENLEKTPVAVSVVSGEDLSKRQIVSEADLQAAVPGLTVRATSSSEQLNYAIRGQSVDAFSGSRPAVLPYIDEVQVNNNSSTAFYDLASVQVLKGPQGTLFGRNATGGAVLFTTEKPTDDVDGFITSRVGNYNDRQVEGAVNLPLVKDTVLLRVAGFFQDHDGYQTNLYDDSKVGETRRSGGRATLVVKPVDSITNTLVVDYAHFDGSSLNPVIYGAYPAFSTNPAIPATVLYGPTLDLAFNYPGAWAAYLAAHPKVDPAGLYAYAALQAARGPYTISINSPNSHEATPLLVANTTSLDLGGDMQLKNIFGYTHSRNIDAFDYDGTPYGIEGSAIATRDRQYTEEPQLLGKAMNGDLSYVTGLYFSDDVFQNHTTSLYAELEPLSAGTSADYLAQSRSRSYAGYAQGTYDLGRLTGIEGLSVTAGGRYTSETISDYQLPGSVFNPFPLPGAENPLSSNFKKPSWQFGVQEQLNPDLLLYVVTRRSFRSGGYNLAAPPFPGLAASGGSGFEPEIATDVEIGAKFQSVLGSMPVRLNAAAYNQWINDIQRTIYVGLPALDGALTALTVNIPEAIVTGVEVDGQINPLPWLNLGANFAYTDARFTQNKVEVFGTLAAYGPFADTPRWNGALYAEASQKLPNEVGTLSLRTDLYSQSLFYFGSLNNTVTPGTELPSYTLVNLRLGLADIERSGVSVAASVRNLTNRVYYVGGTPLGNVLAYNVAIPGTPRTYTLEANYRF